jgi:hypothetical protein
MDWTTILAGPIGGILGLGGALVQKWMGMKEAREAHAMKLEELKVVSSIDAQKAEFALKQMAEQQSGEAFKAAIDAQAQLKPVSSWAIDALALFRPGLTAYLLLASTILALIFQKEKPELIEYIIVSMFSMSSVALGYWFGVRTEEKKLRLK